jgi:diketogulonate reductase-like aldo/keto reductase
MASSQQPIEETMRAMEKLVDEGLIKLNGTSNFSVEQLKKTRHALMKYTIACNQVLYHLAYRGIERDVVLSCVGIMQFLHEH